MISNIGVVIIWLGTVLLSLGTQKSFALGFTYQERMILALNYKSILMGCSLIIVYLLFIKIFLLKKLSNEN